MEFTFGLLGGLGLFLLGMSLFSEGLKKFAGDSLRVFLLSCTASRWRAFLSGASVTALVQSSSATTVMVIGFVSSGLITFNQALGVVMGASFGTTATSWIIAWIGLKFSVGVYALPVLGLGAMCKVLGRGRWEAIGGGLAGFALIFLGIGTLQDAMQGISESVDIGWLNRPGVMGVLISVLVGIVLTTVMQSSSATIATALTAMSVNMIELDQAMSIVIGAAIGTTFTGVLASIAGTVSARRTAYAHILFNAVTGLLALVCMPLFLLLLDWYVQWSGNSDPAKQLALFHTLFISLGIVAFWPFVDRFASWLERLVPDTGPVLTRFLDPSLSATPALALAASKQALIATFHEILMELKRGLKRGHWNRQIDHIGQAIQQIQSFLESMPPTPDDETMTQARLDQLHAVDHLIRLATRLKSPGEVYRILAQDVIREATHKCQATVEIATDWLQISEAIFPGSTLPENISADAEVAFSELKRLADELKSLRQSQRQEIIKKTATGSFRPTDALHLLDGYRWLDRTAYHVYRATAHLTSGHESVEAEKT